MGRKSPTLELVEIGGDQYPDLQTVQVLALPSLAADLARVVRSLLESGALVVLDGKITINPESKRDPE